MKLTLLASTLLAAAVAQADFKLPQFDKVQLKNGLTVYVMEQHEVPLIAINAVSNRGAAFDGAQNGLANLTSDALLDGSAKHDKQTLAQAFDFRGASIGSTTGLDASRLNAQWLSKDHADLIPLFAEILLQPQFPAAEFNKLRDRRVQEIKQAKESPRQMIGDYFRQQMFGDSAYGHPVNGSIATINKLQRDDAAAFYRAHYCPAQTAITVVGDFDKNKILADIERYFGGWQAQCRDATISVARSAAANGGVLLVNKADAHETTFMIGSYGIAQSDNDKIQLDVINTILGGRFTSWLNDELRVNSGLTYGARSGFNAYKHDGVFMISSFTAQKNTAAALKLALDTYQRLWTKGIDEATLKSAKAYVKGLYPPRFETPEQLSGLLADMYVNGYGREQIDRFTSAVDSLTVKRCQELIAKHFKRDQLHMTLVGQADAIREIAKQYGNVKEVDINAE